MNETTEAGTITASAVICTHNGGALLPQAVSSLSNQNYPAHLYDIIVVDNASTDDTKDVVDQLSSMDTVPITYVFEPELGLSNARNRAMQVASGEVVAFIDDDALVDPQWLSRLMDVYREYDAACVGGPVVPEWPSIPPAWLPSELYLYLTIVDMGDAIRELHGLEYPVGTNISYKRAAVLDVGGFDSRFGRKGGLLLSGEEDELCERLETAGYARYYTPHAVVNNLIREDRLTKKWFLSRGYWQGRTSALRGGSPIYIGDDMVTPTLRSFARCAWGLSLSAAKRDAKRLFLSRFCLAYIRGAFVGRLKGAS